ncbi:hypothetical protein Egran_06697 [Elaphomyces granulatus]|uniref:ADF-H domain-containing protein n=1 Tax=Elaphomyces granulatus TaxID=519963 RepID=A0A232LN11_9EURO|nr:hypothetical protein Egran_06697 [Elaphomyces granulatus]
MSLNGLDDPAVIEAYQTALAEAGGWLLLKYLARDEVALLGRGTGGVSEVRSTIEGYHDKSPLYGFLQYRRRKVVLKFVPEGISRLLQARTTVQFNSVLDRFSPQDTIFSFSAASELTESTLSSACLLHAASGSMTSSSSSLRRRKLMEIAEDSEEGGTSQDESTASPSQTADKRTSQLSEATAVPSRPPSPVDADADDTPIPDSRTSFSRDDADSRTDASSIHSTARRLFFDQLSQQPYESRRSSQSMRPSLQDLDSASLYRPKVKLGPRPSIDTNGRPRTAGSLFRGQEPRPVATLPAGLRSSSRKSGASSSRPRSQPDSIATPLAMSNIPPVPALLIPPSTLGIPRPPLSPGAKSMTAVPSSGMTPEKQRLMKALELRKKQMEKRTRELQLREEKLQEATKQAVTDISANKENINEAESEPRAEGHEMEAKLYKEPLCESRQVTQPSDSCQTIHDEVKPSSPVSSKPDSAVEVAVVNPEYIQTPDTSTPILATTILPSLPDGGNLGGIPLECSSEPSVAQKVAEPIGLGISEDARLESVCQVSPTDSVTKTTLPDSTGAVEETQAPKEMPEALPLPKTPHDRSRPGSFSEECSVPQIPRATDELASKWRNKRRALLEPIQVSGNEYSDEDNLLSDDSFIEELKTAKVQEAKPVSLGKSPLSPTGQPQTPLEAWRSSRSVSNPSGGGELQALPIGRSISASYFENQQAKPVPVLVAKKINVSSGISKRIKALEKFSNSRENTASSSPNLPPGVVPTPSTSPFERFRKRASVSLVNGSSPTPKLTASVSPSPSPELPSKAPPPARHDSVSNSNHFRGKRNSVSVTARIVRDLNAPPSDPNTDFTEPTMLNLQRSPLIVECDQPETPSPTSTLAINKPEDRRRSMSSSAGSKRDSIITMMRREESGSSISSRSKLEDRRSRSASDAASSPEEKRESRKSRIFRRMSSITSSPRRSILNAFSPTVREEEAPSVAVVSPTKSEELLPEPPQAVDIGEVNVQFPDTLLWKRRFLRVDELGYLILTPGNVDSSTRNMVKRYHLSEFKTPCLPDEDRQELPNSILLDFCDGSTLQCACESRQGQAAVLQTLVDAHAAYQ